MAWDYIITLNFLQKISSAMSYCRKDGKDVIIFATVEDHSTPSKITLPESEPSTGLILPNGEINWNCPCLGGMATGPCGLEFREAFSCFHTSATDPKGTECYDAFREMHLCMAEYPDLYDKDDEDSTITNAAVDVPEATEGQQVAQTNAA